MVSYGYMLGWVLIKFLFWGAAFAITIDTIVLHLAYRRLCKEYEDLYQKYKASIFEMEAVKSIHQGCSKAERTLKKEIDFDGTVEINMPTNAEDAWEYMKNRKSNGPK